MLIDKIKKEIAKYGGTIEKNKELDQYVVQFPEQAVRQITTVREAFMESGHAASSIYPEKGKLRFQVSSSSVNKESKIKLTVNYGNFEKVLYGEQVLFAIYGTNETDDHAAAVIGDGDEDAMLAMISGALMAVERTVGVETMATMVAFIMSQRLNGESTVELIKTLKGEVGRGKDIEEI